MSLFDKEFFPTPEAVIRRMVEPYADILASATILEPSAGNGAITDFIKDNGVTRTVTLRSGKNYDMEVKADPEKIHVAERNPELQMILQTKGYRLVAPDFLSYWPDTSFNLILMNPPFSNGDAHLLHAWDILHGGDIACLLNAETVNNPHTVRRKQLAAIIAENGTVENLGRCFRDADNATDVEVVLVRLHKEAKDETFKLDLDGFTREAMPDFGAMTSETEALTQSGRLDAFIRAWDLAKAAAVNYIKASEMLRLYMSAFLNVDDNSRNYQRDIVPLLEKHLTESRISDPEKKIEDAYNYFVSEGKKEAWSMIFQQMNLSKYMTNSLRQKLFNFRDAQSSMAITKENVMSLFQHIMLNIRPIMDSAVSEVYDLFTRYHKDNTSCSEGWKTNKQFHCNNKVILPDVVDAGYMPNKYGYNAKYSVTYHATQSLEDIDKAMCWLAGRNYESLTGEIEIPGQGKAPSPKDSTIAETIRRIDVGDQGWHESAFFRVKAFKKGTIHLEFKDNDLWAKFNLVVNQNKNLIGTTEAA